ncbi:MAG: DUF445 domain-containing protein [Chloroflexota bacterium]|nr:DUF445 domain-containing protein [Chloroflexota bacterium]
MRKVFHKSLVTTIIAAGFVVAGLLLEEPSKGPVLNIGLFALSGAVTNWLAIHMLFEKVPGLYGSGVVPARFEDFKNEIHGMVMYQFFTRENVEQVFENSGKVDIDFGSIIDDIDVTPAFDSLVGSVMESSLGKMLGMFGGQVALNSMKEPFSARIKSAFKEIVRNPSVRDSIQEKIKNSSAVDEIIAGVATVVQNRIDELTPQIVKEIVQAMIREHLGWLVVWGGVFGGLIGLITNLIL